MLGTWRGGDLLLEGVDFLAQRRHLDVVLALDHVEAVAPVSGVPGFGLCRRRRVSGLRGIDGCGVLRFGLGSRLVGGILGLGRLVQLALQALGGVDLVLHGAG
ncbi:hypothetical protein D3C78_1000060 [compost metagenome]